MLDVVGRGVGRWEGTVLGPDLFFLLFCFTDDIPQCSSLRVPKIQTIYGVIGMLKLLAGKLYGYVKIPVDKLTVNGHEVLELYSVDPLICIVPDIKIIHLYLSFA